MNTQVEPYEVVRRRELQSEINRVDSEGAEIAERYEAFRREHFVVVNGRLSFVVAELDEAHKQELERQLVGLQREIGAWRAKWAKTLEEWAALTLNP